jgi:hypothetical protein
VKTKVKQTARRRAGRKPAVRTRAKRAARKSVGRVTGRRVASKSVASRRAARKSAVSRRVTSKSATRKRPVRGRAARKAAKPAKTTAKKQTLRERYRSEYATWTMVRQRCLNKRCKDYPRYGGRGIKIARKWDSFETFLEDLGPRPRGYSLVRRNADASFTPNSCAWEPRAEQQRRRSNNALTEKDVARIRAKYKAGVRRADLARQFGVSLSHICYIIEGRRWKPAA